VTEAIESPPLIGDWAAGAEPPPLFTVSEWADTYRQLPETSAERGGRWNTAKVPYLRGIMDAVHEPGVRKIAVMKGAQVGGSEALHNLLGYFMAYDPCPMLMVQPTVDVAIEWSKERLGDMLRSTEALRELVREGRDGRDPLNPESTLQFKIFPGGYLALGGANTPNTFARRAVRLAFGDDVDRFPAVVGDEGDPADLLEDRIRTFPDGLVALVSTPKFAQGRIDTVYRHSDQRRYMLTCPSCGREDWVTWGDRTHFHVTYEGHDPNTARLVCPADGCGAAVDEAGRRVMVLAGRWVATAAALEPGCVGFHLPATISLLGDVTLPRLVSKWLTARARGRESLRVFINTSLAEGWEDRGARMNPHALLSRRESYGPDVEVPEWAVALTAGVDVQDDRFEILVTAWGVAEERAVVDWRSVPGNPKHAETRAALLEALKRRYRHATGHQLPIHATCVDTGFATEEMYDFVLAHQARRIYATKGFAGKEGEPIVGKPSERRRGKDPRPVRLYPVNVDDAKGDVMNAITLTEPGPGYLHLPFHLDTIDEEFCAQICAEHRETRYNRVGVATHAVWVQDRDRNEALDCSVLCLAAFKLLNPNVHQMLQALRAATPAAGPSIAGSPGAGPAPTSAPVPQRRVSRSAYLNR
jgi:phage terminase large subunit GpA-like protein